MLVLVLPDIPHEDDLLARARRGDQPAVMEIYEQYFEPVYQYLRMRTDETVTAEDLASEVFLQFLHALKTGSAPRISLRGWLFKVARNLLAQHYQQAAQLPQITLEDWLPLGDDRQNPEAFFMHNASLEKTRHALRMLNEHQQEVLVLRFGQMLSLEETADIMGKSVGAVKSLQFRAVSTLREILTGT